MAPPVKELTRPPLQRRPNDPPRAAPMLAEDGTQLQVRISELEPASLISDGDQLEVNQGGISRRMSIQQMKSTTAPDLDPFLTGISGGDGIQVLGGAPVPTVQLDEHGAPGTFGDATNVPQITVDEFGRVSSVTLVEIAQPDVSGFAPIASPTFTGDPKAPTPAPGDSDTSVATTAFVQAAINGRGFAPINNPAFTGTPTAPTPAPGDNDTSIATTAFVEARVQSIAPVDTSGLAPINSPNFTGDPRAPTPALIEADTSIATTAFVKGQGYAPLASPVFTGNPTAPTPAVDDNDTSIATTEFVTRALAAKGSGGDASISVGTTPPADPAPNQLWFNSDSRVGQMFIYYDDGNSQAWVPTSPSVSTSSPGGDFMVQNNANVVTGQNLTTVLWDGIVTGNTGNYYNLATGRYTPPAGRYFIHATMGMGANATAQCTADIYLRKNGVVIARGGNVPGTAGWWADSAAAVVIDASGTDWFDVQIQFNVVGAYMAATAGKFLAFPLSGIKGPPGNIGSPVASFNVRTTINDVHGVVVGSGLSLFRSTLAGVVKDYDPDNVWDLTNARFTAPSTGRYAFQCSTYLSPNPACFTSLILQHQTAAGGNINAYNNAHMSDTNNYGTSHFLSLELQMTAGDRLQAFIAGANAGSTITIYSAGGTGFLNGPMTWISGRKVV